MKFTSKLLPNEPDTTAPDTSEVRQLLALRPGSMAHFRLHPNQTSKAVAHRSVDEIWYVVRGHGEMWRRDGDRELTVSLSPTLCLTVPVGTGFQFRCLGTEPLDIVAVTMPPWPGDDEAYEINGTWA